MAKRKSSSPKKRRAPTAKATRRGSVKNAARSAAGRKKSAATRTKRAASVKSLEKKTSAGASKKKSTRTAATKTSAVTFRKRTASTTSRATRPKLNRPRVVYTPPPGVPSTLDFSDRASAARSGSEELREHLREHTETGPGFTGGDIDANWELAYSSGDEAPGGDNPTPDQEVVDEIGHSLGVEYQDDEELRGAEKIQDRDRHRWELDPASSDDYHDRRGRQGDEK